MRKRENVWVLFALVLCIGRAGAQKEINTPSFRVHIVNQANEPIEGAVAEVFYKGGVKAAARAVSTKKGSSDFYIRITADHVFVVTHIGFIAARVIPDPAALGSGEITVRLAPEAKSLEEVRVTARIPPVKHIQGKTIINVEASVTNTGTNVLEVLEKSPGIIIDRNGGISMQGKSNVLVLIDDKPTWLSGADLNNLLSGMSSSQVEAIELITNPSAKYDAAGNAGIINIRTKKNRQAGWNGTLSAAFSMGRYPKSNNSIALNYKNSRFNYFFTFSSNYNKSFVDIYALRSYFNTSGTLTAKLDQPTSFITSNFGNTLKAGADFYATKKTTLGIALTGIAVQREGNSDAIASWLSPSGAVDSSIRTTGTTSYRLRNAGINGNFRHSLSQEHTISADVDLLTYSIGNDQAFYSHLLSTGGYNEASSGSLPATIRIFSAKADHSLAFGKAGKLESGIKISGIHTDNIADYQQYNGTQWSDDPGKSNHFIYSEQIRAAYTGFEHTSGAVNYQLGLRYENTHYDGHQVGNATRKDSVFANNYAGFFPSGYISWQKDSLNGFTFTAGRRIDRPPFQRLNPFVVIINKYTYERGNPYFRPQYSWNFEFSHQYRRVLTTTISYSITKDYFSQLFVSEGTNILVYTNGNVGRMYNLGASIAAQVQPARWWSMNAQLMYNYKQLKGYDNVNYNSDISQWNLNLNNQVRIGDTYTAELSGFYTSRARNDLQELLEPTGQLSAGIARPLLGKKATIKLSIRDIFFTQVMEGNTDFPNAKEYFILHRDTRVATLAFTYRFGKAQKAVKRSGAAGDEIQRVGAG